MANKLLFNSDKSSVIIKFENDKDSDIFENRKEALKAIVDCLKIKKITKDEMIEFTTLIIEAKTEKLQWTDAESKGTLAVVILEPSEKEKNVDKGMPNYFGKHDESVN